ncbi:MAG: T9SS type A sorting domain-containing protein, partial [Chitinophagaceae bacterium]
YPATSTAVTFIGNPSGGSSGTNFFVDIAVNPVGGVMYGVTFNSRLYTINMTTGVSTFIGTHIGTDYIASLFFDETGNLFGYRQDGSFFLIDKTNATLTNAGTGTPYTYADGCSCSFGRVFHDLTSQKGICPTVANPNPEWDITVATTNQTSSQQTGLTYTLEIPSNRFSIIETPAVIANRLFTAGLIPANNPSLVTISTVAPAAGSVKNKIVVSSFQTGGVNSTISFTLKLKLVTLYGAYAPVPLQSSITGLPAIIGSSDLSNDPTTATPDDPTLVNFCPLITLPAKLISFTGVYKNNTSLLYWVAENQVNLSHYEVERSENGTDFSRLTIKAPQQSSTSREQYQYTDDIAGSTAATLYYRLKIVDTDGQYKYSNIILIRRETKAIDGISISPNPVINADNVTVRITANATKNVDLKVMDMAGRVMLQQQTRVTEGNNSITLNNLNRLQAGIYLLQMMDGSDLNTIKFVITR